MFIICRKYSIFLRQITDYLIIYVGSMRQFQIIKKDCRKKVSGTCPTILKFLKRLLIVATNLKVLSNQIQAILVLRKPRRKGWFLLNKPVGKQFCLSVNSYYLCLIKSVSNASRNSQNKRSSSGCSS